MSSEELVEAANKQKLDGIAVTDHDTMENVNAVRELSGNLEIIPGVEITTDEGHILAWYIEEIPETTDSLEVIEEVHSQGGYTSLAHPQDILRQVFEKEEVYKKTDFVEAVNSRVLPFWCNRKASEKAEKFDKPVSGGSDAHFAFEVGRAVTETETNIKEALANGKTEVSGRGGYFSGHITTKTNDFLRYLKNESK
jgi:predicted metal-dependent phosphoesterase TrpH